MYKVIWNLGSYEGWSFEERSFDTPEEALEFARTSPMGYEFKIIIEVTFKAVVKEEP